MKIARVVALLAALASCGAPAPHELQTVPRSEAQALPPVEYRLRGGGVWRSTAARGKVVVIDVWATYCKPCRKAFPRLDRIHALGSGVVVIGVSVDEDDAVVEAFLRETPAGFAIGRDPAETVKLAPLLLSQLPTVLVLDREGRVRFRGESLVEHDYDRLHELVAALIAEPR